MKKKNKGFTLLELLICVALISVVVVFLFRLINTVRNDEKSIGYIRSNQVKRNQIMGSIGTIVSEEGICSFSTSGSSSTKAVIVFNLCSGNSLTINVEKTYFSILHKNGNTVLLKEKYVMSDSNAWYDPMFIYKHGSYYGYDYYRITFKTEKKGMDSTSLDDIEIYWVRNIGNSYMSSTGEQQIYEVPKTGVYLLEVWGAQGASKYDGDGGYGAYAAGEISLTEGQRLMINIGGQGDGLTGGYNGGGNGGATSNNTVIGYGGGGATSIALSSGVLSSFSTNQTNLLIAAAGGGGGGNTNGSKGGSGGGITGVSGISTESSTAYYGIGATQTAGGTTASLSGNVGTFGKGANYYATTDSSNNPLGGAGGGGGLYGGGGSSKTSAGAGGGSSYIGNANLSNGVVYCYHCTESTAASTKTISTNNKSALPISGYAKLGSGAAKITLISKEYNYDYTGSEQAFTVPASGTYKLETWGAQGGGANDTDGGYGGYATTSVYLSTGQTLYINVGGQPTGSSGGYNGGGAGKDFNIYNGYGGGGATHIALTSGPLEDFENDLNNLLVAAGGGGGSATQGNAKGGSAGGITGNTGLNACTTNESGTGATQSSGGYTTSNPDNSGTFGNGARFLSPTYGGAGGGGGLYGGGSSGKACAGAGGGTSYIGSGYVSDGLMICINTSTNCTTSTSPLTKTVAVAASEATREPTPKKMKIGNGYAKVTYVGRGNTIDYSNHVYYSNGISYESLHNEHRLDDNNPAKRATFANDAIIFNGGVGVYNILYTDTIDLSLYNTVIIRKENFYTGGRIGFSSDPYNVNLSGRTFYKPTFENVASDIYAADISGETRNDLKFYTDCYTNATESNNTGKIYYLSFTTKTLEEVKADYRFVE
ncbi:MAG: prepilin-type N-terminal cleavage/methylation domain-containing protein [Bacilli bacterium]|nr:prepilin-type N-terminal cleavage/methylation domain-containing protein [Bacilli bacterium]